MLVSLAVCGVATSLIMQTPPDTTPIYHGQLWRTIWVAAIAGIVTTITSGISAAVFLRSRFNEFYFLQHTWYVLSGNGLWATTATFLMRSIPPDCNQVYDCTRARIYIYGAWAVEVSLQLGLY